MRRTVSFDSRRIALLLIDLQEEQRLDPTWQVAGFETVVGNARRLLLAARKREIPVFHAAFRRDFDVCPPRPFEPVTADGAPAFSDKASSSIAICKEVEPFDGEPVIFKNDASAFSGGELGSRPSIASAEWLIVAGIWSEACVAATVRDAIARGLRVLLVKDACGSGTEAMHQTAILNIANRLYGGGVVDTGRALALLAGGRTEIWMPERPVPILFHYGDAAEHYRRL